VKGKWYNYYSDGQNPANCCDSGEYYYFYDALGNVNGVLDSGGHYYRWEMDAFGNDLPSGNSFLDMDQPGPKEHLTGKMFDTTTGLYYFAARWYDPQVGRFVSVDPLWNVLGRYCFAHASPSVYADPTGQRPIDPHPKPDNAFDCEDDLPTIDPSCCGDPPADLWSEWKANECVRVLLIRDPFMPPVDAYRQCKGAGATRRAGIYNCEGGRCDVWYIPSGNMCYDRCLCRTDEAAWRCVLRPNASAAKCEIEALDAWFDCVEETWKPWEF